MTLNGHFALKSVLGSACHKFASSGFRTKLFENMQSCTHRPTVSGKNVAGTLVFDDIHVSVMRLFTEVP